jgi:hypothetical protein
MFLKINNPILNSLFVILALAVVLQAAPAIADSMSPAKGDMMKGEKMMDDDTMMKEPDSMMADTAMMMDESKEMMGETPMMEGSDSMMADTATMMDDGGGKMMK